MVVRDEPARVLDDTIAFVTGGASGIGRTVAASGKASDMTGADVPVDGGWTAHRSVTTTLDVDLSLTPWVVP
jgi:NAD(P)-dependent dehydrogenase (short-subunit alcohol dehydrogenase family)